MEKCHFMRHSIKIASYASIWKVQKSYNKCFLDWHWIPEIIYLTSHICCCILYTLKEPHWQIKNLQYPHACRDPIHMISTRGHHSQHFYIPFLWCFLLVIQKPCNSYFMKTVFLVCIPDFHLLGVVQCITMLTWWKMVSFGRVRWAGGGQPVWNGHSRCSSRVRWWSHDEVCGVAGKSDEVRSWREDSHIWRRGVNVNWPSRSVCAYSYRLLHLSGCKTALQHPLQALIAYLWQKPHGLCRRSKSNTKSVAPTLWEANIQSLPRSVRM